MQNFIASLLFHVLLPFAPLLVEYWQDQVVSRPSLLLVGAVYSFLVGVSSENVSIFAICFVIGILFALASGNLGSEPTDYVWFRSTTFYTIALVSFIHAVERFYRHVVQEKPIFMFMEPSKSDR